MSKVWYHPSLVSKEVTLSFGLAFMPQVRTKLVVVNGFGLTLEKVTFLKFLGTIDIVCTLAHSFPAFLDPGVWF